MRVCPMCFGNKGLCKRIREILSGLSDGPCDFHPKRKGVAIKAVAEIVDPVFRENYYGGW